MSGGVAVLIPARDAAARVGRAVASALTEPQAVEVLVIDDGSTDDTAAVAWRAGGGSSRLRVLQQPNAGPSAALNRGHLETRAELLCVLDSHDFFVPGRLGRLLAGPSDWDFAADRLLLAREGAEDGPYELWRGRLPVSGRLDLVDFVSGNITDPRRPRPELGYLQPVYRREFVERHGLRYAERVRLGEDYLFYAEALARGARFKVVEAPGYIAVARAASLSHRHRSADLRALLEADEQLLRIAGLSLPEQAAFRRHVASVRERWIYHLALDAKAEGRLPDTLPILVRNVTSLPYAVRQTLSARLGRLLRGVRPETDHPAPGGGEGRRTA